jgi:site-specific recombinase XerD
MTKPGSLDQFLYFHLCLELETSQEPRGWFRFLLEKTKNEGYSWHCNRHTFASRLLLAGAIRVTMAELFRHKTLQGNMQYVHRPSEHQAFAVDSRVNRVK